MIAFALHDKTQLFNLLSGLPALEERRDRKAILIRAGLEELIPHMQLDGPSNVAIPLIINHLISYGKTANGQEVLGLFLQAVKADVGAQDQQFLERILKQFHLSY